MISRSVAGRRTMLSLAAPLSALMGLGVSLGLASPAWAQDLTVSAVQVNQAVQLGMNNLVGNNTTVLRVTVGTGGATIANVDAVVRMSVNNVPVAGPPIFSLNGPITAPSSPNLANINDTLNFMVVPPISGDVDFTIQVNPNRNVVETNYNNNTFIVSNQNFQCRRMVNIPYVPINYTYAPDAPQIGLPPANLIEPGIGDGFIRSIYTTEWNFHKAPLPPLDWASNVDSSSNSLLNTLNDIRLNTLPNAGYPQDADNDLIYGFLPGNPYSGNGVAISIPGNTAFGNSDPIRHQRTAAHELGHLFGMQHVTAAINTNGFDEENHLKDTQNLPQIFPSTKRDIMEAGLLTDQAWIRNQSYNTVVNNSKLACPANDAGGPPPVPVMRVSGVITHDTRGVQLDPVLRIARGTYTPDNPDGDIRIEALDINGRLIRAIGFRTDTARERCENDEHGHPVLLEAGSFYALLPETVAGQAIAQIRIIDVASGKTLASRLRTANAPDNAITSIRMIEPLIDGRRAEPDNLAIAGRMRIEWTASDADGDQLTHNLLYTPDAGESWYPLVVNSTESAFEFSNTDIPASEGANAAFALVTSDGLNNTVYSTADNDEGGIAVGPGTPPETFLLTPNTGNTFPQLASVPFHGTSWDRENFLLDGASMVWTSSIDGQIGTGRLFTTANLSPGTHIITLTATDANSMSSFKQVTITITPRTVISPDCNNNYVLDLVDIQSGTSLDTNANGIPDECETTPCPGDTNGSGTVDVDDLVAVILAWGACPAAPATCPADVNDSGVVDVDDLVSVILAWGACP